VSKYIMCSLISLYTFVQLVLVSRYLCAHLMFYSCFRVSRTILARINLIRIVPEEIEEEMKFVHALDTKDARNTAAPSHLCRPCAARTVAAHHGQKGVRPLCRLHTGRTFLAEGCAATVRPAQCPHTLGLYKHFY